DGKHALPSYGAPLIGGAVFFAVIFFVWERFSRTKLIEPTGVHFRPFLSALGSSLCAGAALMVTLVDVELFAQGVLGKDQDQAALMLLWFLAALPIGALLGGAIATRIGDRAVAFAGLLIAAGGYWLISKWSINLLDQDHHILGLSLPALHTDLAIAGIGLGLVIAPLTSASLRVVPSAQHGIASAAVVVARMTGMLIGVAALSAWGFYRLPQLVAKLASEVPRNAGLAERVLHQATLYRQAFAGMYGEIFEVTVVVCVVGAFLGLLIGSRSVHAEEPEVLDAEPVAPRL
ncbi:MAG: hypothetical protein QOD34_1219, partial [Mycobacterium sp.]|nr:hypothetical protein [Mycobacterium sp.]